MGLMIALECAKPQSRVIVCENGGDLFENVAPRFLIRNSAPSGSAQYTRPYPEISGIPNSMTAASK